MYIRLFPKVNSSSSEFTSILTLPLPSHYNVNIPYHTTGETRKDVALHISRVYIVVATRLYNTSTYRKLSMSESTTYCRGSVHLTVLRLKISQTCAYIMSNQHVLVFLPSQGTRSSSFISFCSALKKSVPRLTCPCWHHKGNLMNSLKFFTASSSRSQFNMWLEQQSLSFSTRQNPVAVNSYFTEMVVSDMYIYILCMQMAENACFELNLCKMKHRRSTIQKHSLLLKKNHHVLNR